MFCGFHGGAGAVREVVVIGENKVGMSYQITAVRKS